MRTLQKNGLKAVVFSYNGVIGKTRERPDNVGTGGGANMNVEEQFIGAIRGGNADQVIAMLADNPALADAVADDGTSALLTALYGGQTEIADTIAQHRKEPTLFEAAARGDAHRIGELLNGDPARVGAFSNDGFTALHLAVFFGQAEVAEMLLTRGARPDVASQNTMHVLPLHSAVAGSDHDEPTAYALTRMLIESDADVNATQEGGFTPLMAAAQNGHARIVELLVARGVDKTATNDAGKTARDLAIENNHADLAAVLDQASPPHHHR